MQGVSHITFFECSFSSQCGLWFRVLCGMDAISPHLSNVVAFIVPLSKGKIVVSIIFRIVVAATSYYIWLERNVDVQEEDFDPETKLLYVHDGSTSEVCTLLSMSKGFPYGCCFGKVFLRRHPYCNSIAPIVLLLVAGSR
ncbi:hypothetical protein Tco_0915665 [Tanacetum coccineum]